MELRKRHFNARRVFVGLYVLAFAVYIIVGLQPAEAKDYAVSAKLDIPSIGLDADVTKLTLNDNQLDTPDTIVGSYSQAENKTLLIGHSSTVFERLHNVKLRDKITYDGRVYHIVGVHKMLKSDVSMSQLLKKADRDTLVIMTCAGELLNGGDATHRLIITATR